ncbi:MAG: GIY-YIG nuclease family protein [Sphingomonadaceae bacterium]|nr:GIY-YIG nuclease family protein [Sphingomonadaceae bacterium]
MNEDRPINTDDRKASIAAYKERKVATGLFAIRCPATGECWVGRAPDLDTIWQRLSFELAVGTRRRPSLQAAWDAHGVEGFAFEVLEKIEEEIDSVRDKRLKARLDHWRETLGAELA